jgi:hypothetical protein
MTFRASIGVLLCVGGLALPGCAKKPAVQSANNPTGLGLETELMEPGAEPREQLRYQRAPGLTEHLVIQFGLATLLETSAAGVEAEAPVLSLGLTMGAVSRASEDTWRYPFTFRVIGIKMPEGSSEAQAAEVAHMIAPLAGVSGAFEVDERGLTRRADVVVPADLPPRLISLLGNIRTSLVSVPLPEEAVGVGARWKVQRAHQVGRVEATQTVVYTLLERKERVLRLGVTLQQSARPQAVLFDKDIKFQLEAYEVSGTGNMLMNLDAIIPLGELRGTSDLRGTLRHGDAAEPLRASGAMQVVVAPVEAGSAG